MILVASGAVSHTQIVKLAEDSFSALKSGQTPAPVPRWIGGELRKNDVSNRRTWRSRFRGWRRPIRNLCRQVYVGARRRHVSRLFGSAREAGLCYSIYAFAQAANDGGVIGSIPAGETEAGDRPVIAGEMAALAEGATDAEVARAKAQLKSGLLMGLERPMTRAEQIASQMFSYGRVLGVEELTARLEEVDASAVKRFGSQLMNSVRPSMAALGPVDRIEDYETFAVRFGGSASMRAAE
jgi:predicted Zn-dependent peptidase